MKNILLFYLVFIATFFSLDIMFSKDGYYKPDNVDIAIVELEKISETKQTITIKNKIKNTLIYPEIKVGGKKYKIDSVKYWDEVLLLAATINSECRGCSYEEKEVIAQFIANRVDHNYDGFGKTYYEQISGRSQFSGFKRGKYCGKYFFYDGRFKIRDLINNRIVYLKNYEAIKKYIKNNNVSFDDLIILKDEDSLENYEIAYNVIIKGYRSVPCNGVNFCNSKIATNKKEVARQKRNQINLSQYGYDVKNFGHDIFAEDKKIKC